MTQDIIDEPTPKLASPLAGRYVILGSLGSGGMADVYLARDDALAREVAVKVLKARLADDPEFVERFRVEAQAAAQLNHPNIVAVYDRAAEGPPWFITMEYVRGETLRERLRRLGPPAPEEAARIVLAVLAALQAAHERHVVHRDVTPSNVLIDEAGVVKVADFGIARIGVSALTRTGTMLGTASYLSPEQAQGQPADERSDLYSAGVMLYELLTGRLPFAADRDVAMALKHVSEPAPDPRDLAPDVPAAFAAITLKAMAKARADRYQTAAEFAAAVKAAVTAGAAAAVAGAPAVPQSAPAGPKLPPAPVTHGTVAAADAPTALAVAATHVVPEPETVVRPRRRRPGRWLAALVAVAAVAVAGWALWAFVLDTGVAVPSVVGRSEAVAEAALRKEGLAPTVHRVYSDKYSGGRVVRQLPRPGAQVAEKTPVDLWVSKGPLHIPAPDVRGLAPDQAARRLEGAALKWHRHTAPSDTAAAGEVSRQEPAAGATVARGATVDFWVSTGPSLVPVPDVVGLSEGDASAELEDAGFVVSVDLTAGFGEYPGDVIAQDPVAGERVRRGTEVVISVAVF